MMLSAASPAASTNEKPQEPKKQAPIQNSPHNTVRDVVFDYDEMQSIFVGLGIRNKGAMQLDHGRGDTISFMILVSKSRMPITKAATQIPLHRRGLSVISEINSIWFQLRVFLSIETQ
jgi:hypothetical protein